jgi:hypothetical protein
MKNNKDGMPYYKLMTGLKIPRDQLAVIKRRVGGLACFDQSHRPLLSILANAYVLGCIDAIDVMNEK